jgi:Tfp pilus assembly protein PilN
MIEVNLHPAGSKARRRGRRVFSAPAWLKEGRDRWTMAVIAISALALLAVGWLWMSQRSERQQLEDLLAESVEDSTRLADLRALSDSLLAREEMIRERLGLVRSLDENRFVWPHLFDEMSRALPPYTWLTAVRETTPLPELSVQLDGLAANPLAITAFVRNLQASPYIAEVRIVGSQQQELDNVAAQAFKLVVLYTAPPDSIIRRQAVRLGRS